MRIGLVGPLPPPAGGMANQTRQLSELLSKGQANVLLVQTNAPYFPEWVGRVFLLRALFRLIPYIYKLWRMAGAVDVVHVMANSGWSWHLFTMPAIWVGKIRNVPVVINYRGGEAAGFLARSYAVIQFSLKRVSALIVPSGFLQEVFSRYGIPSRIVPNIIDLSRFHPRAAVRNAGIHLIVTRNLEPIYDNETALRAFQIVWHRYSHACLTIAGTGPEESRLRNLARQLGLDSVVTFAGRLDRDRMADLYRQADVMINPSLVDNMPNSILESMACGVPVVSTDVGGIPYMVQDGVTALLVKPGDPEAMAAAILDLIENTESWSKLSIAGIAEVQRYTWAQVAPVLAEVYRSATGRLVN